jgi:hypothetical protein
MNKDELILKSRFTTFFIAKQILGFGVGTIVVFLCFYNSFDEEGLNISNTLFYFGIITCIFLLIFLVGLITIIKTITLTESAIKVFKLFSRKGTTYQYEDIESLNLVKERGYEFRPGREEVYAAEGEFVLYIKFINGEMIDISPYYFKNFKEMVDIISTRHNSGFAQ